MTTAAAIQVPYAVYERADQFLRWNAQRLAYNLAVRPHWIDGGSAFWYCHESAQGTTFVRVDPEGGATAPAFNHADVATALSRVSGREVATESLPFTSFTYGNGGRTLTFDAFGSEWRFETDSGSCELQGHSRDPRTGEATSPDGRLSAFVRDHDLYVRTAGDGVMRLTDDGVPYYDYGTLPDQRRTTVTERLLGHPARPAVIWAPNSRKLLSHRLDQRQVGEMHVIESVLPDGERRPKLHTWRMAIAADEHVPLAELMIFDVETGTSVMVDAPPFNAVASSPLEQSEKHDVEAWWTDDSREVYFLQYERGFTTLRLYAADAATGKTRVVVEERDDSEVKAGPARRIVTRTIGDRSDLIWYSERDGWGHLYHYDGRSGELRNRITAGDWVVLGLEHVEPAPGWIYFTACGREPGRNPYYSHLYRVRWDGSDLELLTPDDAHHQIWFSPNGRYFVAESSRMDQPPVVVLYDCDGKVVQELARGDVEELRATGWTWPEPFRVKARDGETDIYGVLFFPPDFDPDRTYPIVDDIYPGPQQMRTPLGFTFDPAQALAALGFITVVLDGMGTPYRSKAFHHMAYGQRYGEAGGLEDHVAAIKQLAAERRYIDIERVGIYGHSAGGYASARAMFKFPDFFKVCVSSAGNHDQRRHRAGWGERWAATGADQANAPLAHNLKGKLLIAYGDIDDTVHHAQCLDVIDALIKANKDFDLLVLPNRNHGFYDLDRGDKDLPGDPYFIRRRWDYFVRHLLGAEPPADYEVRRPEPAA